MMELPYAEDVNYWKSGTSSPDTWMERAKKQVENLGGKVLMEAFGKDATERSAYMLAFEIGGDRFKVIWPVLPSKSGNEKAARIQAATMLYHDIKARCLTAMVMGTRSAFFSYLLLSDGRVATQADDDELADLFSMRLLGRGIE